MYVYKCISVPEIVNTGNTGKNSHNAAINHYEKLINSLAVDGWELDMIDSVSSLQNPGCLGQLIGIFTGGAKSEMVTFKLLIFRKQNSSKDTGYVQSQKIEIPKVSSVNVVSKFNTCPSCSNPIRQEDIFCENCGQKLK